MCPAVEDLRPIDRRVRETRLGAGRRDTSFRVVAWLRGAGRRQGCRKQRRASSGRPPDNASLVHARSLRISLPASTL